MKRHDKLPLKKAYYRIFTGMIVIPLVLVLVLSLVILGMQYREQAIENIRGVQKGVAAELQSDVDFMSMRLSQLINVNDNMVIQYAVAMNEADQDARYDAQKKLEQTGNMVIEPVKDVVSIGFYMKTEMLFPQKQHQTDDRGDSCKAMVPGCITESELREDRFLPDQESK